VQKTEHHVPVLDAIRGLAILLVLFIHIGGNMPAPQSYAWKVFSSLTSSSWVGVDLFFVLSGFLITGILYDTRQATNFFRTFYARRFLRIFPLYYGFLFLLVVLTIPLAIEWRSREWIYLFYLQNTHVMKNVHSAAFSPFITIDYLWSLAVEEQFYCVWPAMVFFVKDRIQLMKMAGLVMAGSMLVRLLMLYGHKSLWMIYIFTPARADSLMMGSVLALLFRSDTALQQQLKRLAIFVLPASVIVLVTLALPTGGLSFDSKSVIIFGYTIIGLASAALITLSLTSPTIGAAINRPSLRWLGKCSYGIYVLHLPVMQLLLRLHTVTQLEDLYSNPCWRLLIVVSTAAFAVGLAFLSFEFYESRFLRLKRFFRYQFPEPIAQRPDENVVAIIDPAVVQTMES
jgi:peptidoglycan/LPS O-acetylase OafA/YrhL